MTEVIKLPPPFRHAPPKDEPIMSFVGEGKYHYAVLKEGEFEVMHRVPIHFFYLEGEKKLDMVKDICGELKKKMNRAKRGIK